MSLNCQRCRTVYTGGRPDHFASDPQCGFEADGTFRTVNWNCVTLNALRDLAEPNALYHDDDHLGMFAAPENTNEGTERGPVYVLLRWYKHRGRTDAVLVWASTAMPRPITLAEAEAILDGARQMEWTR